MVNAEMLVSQHLQQQCSVLNIRPQMYVYTNACIYKRILYHRLGDHDGREGVKEKPEDGEECFKMLSVLDMCWSLLWQKSAGDSLGRGC